MRRQSMQELRKNIGVSAEVGTFETCRSRCLIYSSAFVFASSYKLEDTFDFNGMLKLYVTG